MRCLNDICQKEAKKRGYCENHYRVLFNKGAFGVVPCSIQGCGKHAISKGYCRPHYKRFLRHGDPFAGNRAKGGGGPGAGGYWRITTSQGTRKLAHRDIMERHLGRKLLVNEHVHHINGNRLDNRIENLAILTIAEHQREHHKWRYLSDISAECTKCRRILPKTEFWLDAHNWTGLQSQCKTCKAEMKHG